MRRVVSIVVVVVWVGMMMILVRRTWPTARETTAEPPPLDAANAVAAGDEWLAVYHQHQKIGYTHQAFTPEADGFAFQEDSLLRLTVMEQPQTVRTRLQGHAAPNYALRDAEFELSSGVGHLLATAAVTAEGLRVKLQTGVEASEQLMPLQEPIFLSSTLRASLRNGHVQPGQRLEASVFDPTTLHHDRAHLTIEAEEAVPEQPEVRGFRVREEFHGITTTAWLDASGAVLREEGPMGMVLIRQSAEQALRADWDADTALDIVANAAVPVATPIDAPRDRRFLRVRVSGISLANFPRDDEQTLDGSEVTIRRHRLAEVGTYTLPDESAEHRDELAATAFLQSDHPRVQAAARAALGDERDAKRAAQRLNDWVYASLRKVPTISIPNALQVLEMREGDCNEHAVLLAALSRAVGLPARVVAGAVYLDGAFFYHAWCEVWLNRWVSIDPALHQFPADATHIKFVVGASDDQWAMMEIIGRLGIEVVDAPHDRATE